jgi:hypothetical protein
MSIPYKSITDDTFIAGTNGGLYAESGFGTRMTFQQSWNNTVNVVAGQGNQIVEAGHTGVKVSDLAAGTIFTLRGLTDVLTIAGLDPSAHINLHAQGYTSVADVMSHLVRLPGNPASYLPTAGGGGLTFLGVTGPSASQFTVFAH